MSDQPARERTSDHRVVPWLLAGLVALVAALYVAAYAFTGDRIPRGTTISGVEVGGLLPAAAEQRLRDGLADDAARPVRVVADGHRAGLDPAAAGLTVDTAASVSRAGGGRSWNPARMWDYVAGGHDEDAVVRTDTTRLAAAVAGVAEQADRPPVEGAVTFADGEAEPRYPERGVAVDRAAAAAAVEAAFLHTSGTVTLPTEPAEPRIDKDAVSEAMETFANPAVSGAVTVTLSGDSVRLQPEDLTGALSMEPEDGRLVPHVDTATLVKTLTPKLRKVALTPRDASFEVVDGRPEVVPSRTGVTFDEDDLAAKLLGVLPQTGSDRRIDVRGTEAEPALTTAEATKLGVRQRVSTFTTHFPYAAYRNVNLGRAAELVDGSLLLPGKTFSLNDTVGERTEANGFTKGFIISDGVFKEDFGGGVSQVATTTFNAAFFAGLEDVEHKPHSFYIDRYPVGREATVVWGAVDLRFRNTTPYGVLIQARLRKATPSTPGAMTVTMYSTKYWDIKASQSGRYRTTPPQTRTLSGPECVPNTGYAGFDIDVYRDFYRHGSSDRERRETMHTRYLPADTVRCS